MFTEMARIIAIVMVGAYIGREDRLGEGRSKGRLFDAET